jgi:hypothetical protein
MVRIYGDAHGVDTEPRNAAGAGEGSSLLGHESTGKAKGLRKVEDGHATLASGVGNLANTIVGSGEFCPFVFPASC